MNEQHNIRTAQERMEPEFPCLMTPNEVANLFRVKPQTVYSWVRRGKIPYIKQAGSTRFDKSIILKLLKSRCER